MKHRIIRWVSLYVMVGACVGLAGTALVDRGPTSASVAVSSETAEIQRILGDMERQLDAIEADAGNNAEALRQHARPLHTMLQLLSYLEEEAARTLDAQDELKSRLARVRSRIEALSGRVGDDMAKAEHTVFYAQAKGVAPPLSKAPASRRMLLSPAPVPAGAGRIMPEPGSGRPRPMFPQEEPSNREAYAHLDENPFIPVADDPLSTFSIDVDTASYSNLRRLLNEGRKTVPRGAIRIEEMVNYFKYKYKQPGKKHPLAMDVETTACPWTPAHRLARVALQARTVDLEERKPSNLVFLIDSSGSMRSPKKMDLLKEAYKLLIDNLDDRDKVAMVAYAGSAGLVLPPTTANNRLTLKFAVEKLSAGGSTAGGAGIQLAYKTAIEHFIADGNNRVILATDGDFNVGVSSESALVDLIVEKAKSGVFLTVLGFGTGNYQDSRMESLSNHGNGNYAYIDSMVEARKVFLTDLTGTLYTVAKDVKFQIEFNPACVEAYRLIGYENRQLADRDFTDDQKDAGEVGSGHQVTALYELVPAGAGTHPAAMDKLRYQKDRRQIERDELMNIKVRYKIPQGTKSTEFAQAVVLPKATPFKKASADTRFATAVAAFGMLMRGSDHAGQADLDWVYQTAVHAVDQDPGGFRSGFCDLVRKARDNKVQPEQPTPVPPPTELGKEGSQSTSR